MLIHAFHSKLMSGKEEGRLIEALRRVREAAGLKILMAGEEPSVWSVWMEEESQDGGSLRIAST